MFLEKCGLADSAVPSSQGPETSGNRSSKARVSIYSISPYILPIASLSRPCIRRRICAGVLHIILYTWLLNPGIVLL